MNKEPIPATLSEENSNHGFFWRLNTIKGISIYNAICSFIFLPIAQLNAPSIHDTFQPLFYITAFFSFELLWILMLVPAFLIRLILGGRGNILFGFVAAFLSLIELSSLCVMFGGNAHGSLMLMIYLFGAYKLVTSHFGLHSLGIPLSLPEWKKLSSTPDKSHPEQNTRTSFSPVLQVCYFLLVFVCLARGAMYVLNDGEGFTFAMIAFVPALPLGRFCLDSFGKAITSYRRDYPEKALCYAFIGILITIIWSMVAIGITAYIKHSWNWTVYAVENYLFSLLFILATQTLLFLFLYLCKRFPK